MLQELKKAENLRFPRYVKPKGAVDDPELVMSNDGSKDGMCCTAHLRWTLDSGRFACQLFCAKIRVTQLRC